MKNVPKESEDKGLEDSLEDLYKRYSFKVCIKCRQNHLVKDHVNNFPWKSKTMSKTNEASIDDSIQKDDSRLISVAMLMKTNHKVLFNENMCTIFNNNNVVLMQVPLDLNSHQFKLIANPCNQAMVSSSLKHYTMKEIHDASGHTSHFILRNMFKKGLLKNIKI